MATTDATTIPTGTWAVDPAHTTVEFAVKHLGFATIKGRVQTFEGTVVGGAEPAVRATLDAASLTTMDADRDRHLRTPDFFDVGRHPTIGLTTTRVSSAEGRLVLEARLTIRGVARAVRLAGLVTGEGTDPWGNRRLGIDVEGRIDRRDFGIDWNEVLPGGALLVANEVALHASVSAIRED